MESLLEEILGEIDRAVALAAYIHGEECGDCFLMRRLIYVQTLLRRFHAEYKGTFKSNP